MKLTRVTFGHLALLGQVLKSSRPFSFELFLPENFLNVLVFKMIEFFLSMQQQVLLKTTFTDEIIRIILNVAKTIRNT